MDVLFLGTCAYDYSEKLKCEYSNCFDFNARRASSVLVNGKYLIDCGDHILDSLRIAKVGYYSISDLFITHFHRDHYNVSYIETIAKSKKTKLRVWVREDSVIPDIKNVEVIRMHIGIQYEVDASLKLTGLFANHDEKAYPQHFLFEIESKKFLYACDGAWFLHDTWYRLKDAKLDLLVLDATCGDYLRDYRIFEHNSIPMIRVMLPSMKMWNVITEETEVYLSHIAPSLHKPHQEITTLVQPDGLKVAYDGLQVKI